jgi:hypothetical protein
MRQAHRRPAIQAARKGPPYTLPAHSWQLETGSYTR